MSRYVQLLQVLAQTKPDVIIEIGTWNGLRALAMASQALLTEKRVFYLGFDLFEDATPSDDERELNVKPHLAMEDVQLRLATFREGNPNFEFHLTKGDSRVSVPTVLSTFQTQFKDKTVFVFIDGGHSIETIRSDWENIKAIQCAKLVVVLDDYYTPDAEGKQPDITKFGCNFLANDADFHYIETADRVKDGGHVGLLIWPPGVFASKAALRVIPRNCVPNDEIATNIKANLPRFSRLVSKCYPHDQEVLIVSGGPSLEQHFETIKMLQASGVLVTCVKHAHDRLISAGIIPYSCVLLDPRDHVKDFIENPHPDVRYLVASMVHPSTLDRLLERGAYVIGYNALVGTPNEKDLMGTSGTFIVGGTSAAMRSFSIYYTLGFRKFVLVGFDNCFWTKPDPWGPKYVEVEVAGRKFWTTYELAAERQDFDLIMKYPDLYRITVLGDGIIPHTWRILSERRALERFERLAGTIFAGNRALRPS